AVPAMLDTPRNHHDVSGFEHGFRTGDSERDPATRDDHGLLGVRMIMRGKCRRMHPTDPVESHFLTRDGGAEVTLQHLSFGKVRPAGPVTAHRCHRSLIGLAPALISGCL